MISSIPNLPSTCMFTFIMTSEAVHIALEDGMVPVHLNMHPNYQLLK